MMKSVMIATAALFTMAGVAMAETPSFVGYSEYSIEAKTFELGAGAEVYVSDGFYVTPMIVGLGEADAFTFDHAEVKATYMLNENINLYGKVTSTSDWGYADTTVGVSFQF